MLVVGRRVIPWVLHYVAHTGSRELFRLAVLAIALGVAFGAAKLFGVSLALGAFFAGMIMSESELSHQAAEESLPLRDAFSVLFFVSVGMLFDPFSLIQNFWPVMATLAIIIFGKSVAAFLIVVAFRYPASTALIISASLAQIGEFSFILAELGVGLNLLPEEGRDLILAGAILSIVLNPLVFALVDKIAPQLRGEDCQSAHLLKRAPTPAATPPAGRRRAARRRLPTTRSLIGYGRVGSLVGQTLKQAGSPFLVVEDSDKTLAKLRAEGVDAVSGNAANERTFALTNAPSAKRLILAIPNAFEAGQIVLRARAASPDIEIIARAHSDAEVEHLNSLGVNAVVMGEREIARGIVEQMQIGSAEPKLADEVADPPAQSEPLAGQDTADNANGTLTSPLHVLAAVDVDLRAGDVGRLARAQEKDDVGDFRRGAQPAQRDRLDDLVGAGRQDRRIDLAGRDCIDADAVRPEIVRHFAGQRAERRLRRRIGRAGEGMDTGAGDRGDVDDRALRGSQLLEQAARQHDRREKIDLENVAPDMHRRVDGVHAATVGHLRRDAGIVDERGELAVIGLQPVTDFGDGDADIFLIGQIDLDVVFRPGGPGAILGKSLTRAGDDPPALARKPLDGRMPDATARAGQNQGIAGVFLSHPNLSLL